MLGSILGTTKKKTTRQYADKNPLETFREGMQDAFVNDVAKGMGGDLVNQLLGFDSESNSHGKTSGDMHEGEEITLSQMKKTEEKVRHDIEPGINYVQEIVHGERRISAEQNHELKSQIEQIQAEIDQLMHSSQELETSFKDVVVQRVPVKVGKYHKSFMAFVLNALRTARLKVEDSANCLAMMSGKSRKKGYWQMFKQHGTTFGMSNERSVATQTG